VNGDEGPIVRARGRLVAERFVLYRVRARDGVVGAVLPR